MASGAVESEKVDERPNAMAVRDINPVAPVHVLIFPKEHIPSIREMDKQHCDLIADIFSLVDDITVSEGISQSGYRLVLNCGEEAGQAIDHLHFHLLGGRFMQWPPG